MGRMMGLKDVFLTNLRQIHTDGGDVFHGLKSNENSFFGFGEAYFSNILPGKIKGWKLHKRMTMNLIVPSGKVKFVLFDKTIESFQEETIGTSNYCRLTVPPNIWVAFQGLDYQKPNIVFNLANLEHDPKEVCKLDLDQIEYDWSLIDKA